MEGTIESLTELRPVALSERGGYRWIKRERWTLLWVKDGVCYKNYIVSPWLRWRTFGRRSRAKRELDNLHRLRQSGIPAIDGIGWSEARPLGFVKYSTLMTKWRSDVKSLKDWLRAPDGSGVDLSRALGRVLASLHRGGFVSNTASPRNWLVPAGAELPMLCDPVLLVHFGRSVYARPAAYVDLYSLALSRSRQKEMTAGFRFRLLLAYCDDDRDLTRRLMRCLGDWSPFHQRVRRLWNVVVGHLLSCLPARVWRSEPRTSAAPALRARNTPAGRRGNDAARPGDSPGTR